MNNERQMVNTSIKTPKTSAYPMNGRPEIMYNDAPRLLNLVLKRSGLNSMSFLVWKRLVSTLRNQSLSVQSF